MKVVEDKLFQMFPYQTFVLSSGTWGDNIIGIYTDEEFSMSNMLETKKIGEIISEIKDMASEGADALAGASKFIGAINNIVSGASKGAEMAKKVASGFRDEATPWMGYQKVIAHNHGAITLNFVAYENLGELVKILNKWSMQQKTDKGLWKYEPTDGLSSFFDSKQKSNASTNKGSQTDGSFLENLDKNIQSGLFTLTMGTWLQASGLLVKQVDYRLKTGVFNQDTGKPEFMEVTINLEPTRKLSADELSKWFKL